MREGHTQVESPAPHFASATDAGWVFREVSGRPPPDHPQLDCHFQCDCVLETVPRTLSKKLNEHNRYEYFGVQVGTDYNREGLLEWVANYTGKAAIMGPLNSKL
jgi:hypothetical protein